MLIAMTETDGGRKLLVLGLEQENIGRLLDGQPVYKSMGELGVPGLEEWDVTILGPEDTERFVSHYQTERES